MLLSREGKIEPLVLGNDLLYSNHEPSFLIFRTSSFQIVAVIG